VYRASSDRQLAFEGGLFGPPAGRPSWGAQAKGGSTATEGGSGQFGWATNGTGQKKAWAGVLVRGGWEGKDQEARGAVV